MRTEWAYAAGWRIVRALPAPVAASLFRAGADMMFRRRASIRGVARLAANLRRVVGPDMPEDEFDALLRRALRSYARYWMELFRLPSLSREQILATFRLDGEEILAADVTSGRGAIVALPHAGNWDMAGAWVAAQGWHLVAVAERLRPEGLYEKFVAVRRALGMEIIPLTASGRASGAGGNSQQPPFDVLADRLSRGAVAALLADRDLSARGVEVEFFGGRTRMPPGPALLALRTGAPLYAVEMWYADDAAWARIHAIPVPDSDAGPLTERVRIVTQRLADRFAEAIARHPHDWHMLQRMWLDERMPTSAKRP